MLSLALFEQVFNFIWWQWKNDSIFEWEKAFTYERNISSQITCYLRHGNYIANLTKMTIQMFLFSGPRTRSSKEPRPLFNSEFIDDFYTGDIFTAFEDADDFENAFFMFYAPWDADSIRSVEILETVAKIYADSDLYFAAVNCWEPQGQCHKEFQQSGSTKNPQKNPRLVQHQYPIFIFYPNNRRGIQYNGPISVSSLLEFLLLARKPVEHLSCKQDLNALRARHGGQALVGYFPDLLQSSKSRKALKKFLDATYQILEYDPFQNKVGGIALVTSDQLAFQLQLDSSRPLRLVSFPNKLFLQDPFANFDKKMQADSFSLDPFFTL